VDAYLTVVSKREVRRYADRDLPPEVVRRILEAGRVAGSSRNRQARRFLLLERAREGAAKCVFVPANVSTAALAIAIVIGGGGPASFDAGRAAQNMMLAAWNDGVGSCPNGIADSDELSRLLRLDDSERVVNIVSFGHPVREVDLAQRTAEEWIAAAAVAEGRRPRSVAEPQIRDQSVPACAAAERPFGSGAGGGSRARP
jgi:nitroreductase